MRDDREWLSFYFGSLFGVILCLIGYFVRMKGEIVCILRIGVSD